MQQCQDSGYVKYLSNCGRRLYEICVENLRRRAFYMWSWVI